MPVVSEVSFPFCAFECEHFVVDSSLQLIYKIARRETTSLDISRNFFLRNRSFKSSISRSLGFGNFGSFPTFRSPQDRQTLEIFELSITPRIFTQLIFRFFETSWLIVLGSSDFLNLKVFNSFGFFNLRNFTASDRGMSNFRTFNDCDFFSNFRNFKEFFILASLAF